MAETEHAVAAGVVQHRALEGDHPGAARGQGDVRVDRVVGIEIDVAVLDRVDLRVFVQIEQVGVQVADQRVFGGGGGDGLGQVGMIDRETHDGVVVQAEGAALAGMGAQRRELVEQVGHLDLQKVSGVRPG